MASDKQVLDLIGLRKVLGGLPKDAFVVGLYINVLFSSQYEWLNALAEELRARGMVTVGLFTPRSMEASRLDASHLGATDHVAVVPSSAVKLLHRINVFVISDVDLGTSFPPAAKVLGCAHGPVIIGTLEHPLAAEMYDLAHLDGLMVPARFSAENRRALKEKWTGFVSPERTHRSDRPFQLIPVGYPRHAAMLRALNRADVRRDAIVYAPYGVDYLSEVSPADVVEGQGRAIINFLLKTFPEYSVLFRPAPSDRGKPFVRQIVSFFRNEPRFILDSHENQIHAFSRGAALVTDLSSIARSFAYVTLRAGIFFQPWQNLEPPMGHADCGFVAYTYAGLKEALDQALGQPEDVSRRIRKNRDLLVMPIEGALEDIAEGIQDFYNERPRPGWVTIDRSRNALEPEKELVRKLAGCTCGLSAAAVSLALFRNPESPLLAAYALHAGRALTPRGQPHRDLLDNAARLLGAPVTSATYEDIRPEHIRNLYLLAREGYERQADGDGVALVEELLKDFNTATSKNQ